MNSGTVKFNDERFVADEIEYEGERGTGYVGDMYVDETPIEFTEEEQERFETWLKQSHWVTVKTDVWMSDCGDILCAAARELRICSNEFDLVGTFSLEGVAKEKGVDRFEYMFRSFGDVEFTEKEAK